MHSRVLRSRRYAQNIVLIDHRGTDQQRFEGREVVIERAASTSEGVEAASVDQLASDGRGFARVTWYQGTAQDRRGDLDFALAEVGLMSGEEIERLEWFDPDDRQALLVRYAELGGGARLLGARRPERWFKELLVAFAEADVVKLVDLHADGWRNTDHRSPTWKEGPRGEQLARFSSTPFEVSDDHYAEVDEVLACDDRVIAADVTYHGRSKEGGGELVLRFASVSVIESEVRVSADLYDREDRQAVLVRYTELGGRRSPR
jgi:hypothetical protein